MKIITTYPKGTRTHTKRGVTLLELLIYIAALSGIMVIVSDSFISLAKARGQSVARSEVNAAVRFAGERIGQDIKNASDITTPLLGIPSPTLTMTVGGVAVTYDSSAGQLRRSEGLNSPDLVTGTNVYINTPVFTRLENYNPAFNATTTSIAVSLNFNYNASSTDWKYSAGYQTTFGLR